MKFLNQLTKIINSGQSRSVVLTGNIYDLFDAGESKFVTLLELLKCKLKTATNGSTKGITQIVYQVNHPIEIIGDNVEIETAWSIVHKDKTLKERLNESYSSHVFAFELLRQITHCFRMHKTAKNNLLIIVEGADMLIPEAEISRMSMPDRKAISIVHDWLSDPEFMNGHDSVIMISESRSNLHSRVSKLPCVLSVDIALPDIDQRNKYISEWCKLNNISAPDKLAEQTTGLSIHAVRQLLCSGDYTSENVASKVEEYMISQLGEGVVEFKRPTHRMKDVVGNTKLKIFIEKELIPGFQISGKLAISGVAVSGPIGGGKTYICEAVASELGIPVIVLKNIRSKWFGETDQIFEHLRRLLESFHKIVIFVDEADTMFGDIQSDQDTERRLTGKIQSMMSDPTLKGKVIWFLMTARIHKLSPDIRRPGRIDLIIPVLDASLNDDCMQFIKWALPSKIFDNLTDVELSNLIDKTRGYSAASYSLLKNQVELSKCTSILHVYELIDDMIMPDISETREYQTLQAVLNCTRKSLLNIDENRSVKDYLNSCRISLRELEAKGIQ